MRCALYKEDVQPVFEQLGDMRSKAVTMGNIADVLQARGQLDEALRIRTKNNCRFTSGWATCARRPSTMGKIADILQARGQFDEALRIRTEEQLPIYERLGDVRSLAITEAKIGLLLIDIERLFEAKRLTLVCRPPMPILRA